MTTKKNIDATIWTRQEFQCVGTFEILKKREKYYFYNKRTQDLWLKSKRITPVVCKEKRKKNTIFSSFFLSTFEICIFKGLLDFLDNV